MWHVSGRDLLHDFSIIVYHLHFCIDVPSYYQELVDLLLWQRAGGLPDFLLQFLQVSFVFFAFKKMQLFDMGTSGQENHL